ncbi:hypothetical protein [Flavobacterium psychrophilum]|uniref:hypothetical protein n=1 Tax=Flavobacterium psychrophilum TaxID=96345 RepID=UPI001C8F3E59|nr:hypothetical protein [Flavobacterium psychrophilum]QZK97060.1 hypothetical protein K5L05_06875 [Flavobacterium psychrophilum]
MKKYILIVTSVFLLLSCKKDNQKITTAEEKTPKEQLGGKSELLEGELSIGFEVSSFRPCNEKLDYWIDDSTSRMDSLYTSIVGEDNLGKYKAVYCKLKVYKLPKATDGFASDYDGLMNVDEIIEMSAITPKNKCK